MMCFYFSIFSAESGSSNRKGTCLTESECSEKSGMAAGGCASGYVLITCIIRIFRISEKKIANSQLPFFEILHKWPI